MSDISEQQFDDLVQTMKTTAGSLGKIADSFTNGKNGRANAANQLDDDLGGKRKRTLKENVESMKYATTSTDAFADKMGQVSEKMGKAGGLVFVLSEMVRWGGEAIKTYRDLSDVGQNFSGSLVKMASSAAAAGLPLNEFADLVRKNSGIIARIGGSNSLEQFTKLTKEVRKTAEANGLYGLSIDQLNDYTNTYLDVYRRAGVLRSKVDGNASKSINDLAVNVSALSEITGKSRQEILSDAKEAMSNPLFSATLYENAAQGFTNANDQMVQAVTSLAGQFGETGKMLSKGMAETFSKFGMSQFTDMGKTFIKAGQGQLAGLFDEANRRIMAGEDGMKVQADLTRKLKAQLNDTTTVNSLKVLALGGNEAAEQLLKMKDDLKEMSDADIEAAKRQAKMASLFNSFESVWKNFKGAFENGFLKSFAAFTNDPKMVEAWRGTFDKIAGENGLLYTFGEKFGRFMQSVFTPGNIEKAAAVIGEIIKIGSYVFTAMNVMQKVIFGALNFFHTAVEKLTGSKGIAGVATGMAALVALFAGKSLVKGLLKTVFGGGKIMAVRAQTVIVSGGGGGGGFNIKDLLKKGGKGAAGEAEELAAGAAKSGLLGRILGASTKGPLGALGGLGAKGMLLRGGIGAGVGILGGMAVDAGMNALPDFKGKEALGGALSGAVQGASMGAMFGPWGALIGGVAGGVIGLVTHWESAKKLMGTVIEKTGDALKGIWDYITSLKWLKPLMDIFLNFTPIGLVVKAAQSFASIGKGGGTPGGGMDIGKTVAAVGGGIGGFFGGIGNFFSGHGKPAAPAAQVPAAMSRAPDMATQDGSSTAVAADPMSVLLKEVKDLNDSIKIQTISQNKLMMDLIRINRDLAQIAANKA